MSYLKEIDDLYEKRWKESRDKAQQFFETYFTSPELTPKLNPSSNPSIDKFGFAIDTETMINGESSVAVAPVSLPASDQPKRKKGFTPEARDEYIKKAKAQGLTVMTADGRVDNGRGSSFRRVK
jgi:hypothetical protein